MPESPEGSGEKSNSSEAGTPEEKDPRMENGIYRALVEAGQYHPVPFKSGRAFTVTGYGESPNTDEEFDEED